MQASVNGERFITPLMKPIAEPKTDMLITNDSVPSSAISTTPARNRRPSVAGVGAAEL